MIQSRLLSALFYSKFCNYLYILAEDQTPLGETPYQKHPPYQGRTCNVVNVIEKVYNSVFRPRFFK